ncbi:MAG: TATA-box-binding protein [Candidatus Diapherotrites archaeon]|uniref:TATA-box-binding protein n=1 Tax=Candidatus Iainarchaeum sp. TaxID=3101447 RepID=A0A7J4JUK2_9ARCH|nr:TATA-box-binding protein [Candidatus Diapherotrites archaeon]HIH21461.1 TATA-box-binding protein [Candidatus Diapherotrites archaeon]
MVMEYQIVNLVASANLNATLDLYNLAVSVPNIEYEPEQFPGAILKLKEPKVSMLLFKNGKVICSGASSEEQIEQGIRKASKLIHEIQPSVKVLDKVAYTVVNLVATANLHQTLDLFKTAMSLDNVEYEPEQFPGAILRITEPKITLLLFKNGKVICAGAKREDLLRQGLEKAQKLIRSIKASSPAFEEEEIEELPAKEAKKAVAVKVKAKEPAVKKASSPKNQKQARKAAKAARPKAKAGKKKSRK